MNEDALGVISNPLTQQHSRAQDEQHKVNSDEIIDGQSRPLVAAVVDPLLDGTASSSTTPVTPKSFHSTRSSFKKSTTVAISQPPQPTPSAHIYDYAASSLNSSRRSSLHQHQNIVVNSLTTNNNSQNTNRDIPNVMTTRSIGIIDLAETDAISYNDPHIIVKEPIIIRGAGNLTIFGVCNKFSEQFPSSLNAKLAPEEFRDTIKQINSILNKELENSFKWLIIGSLFCCCTLGCSLLPVIYLNKKAKLCINKLLDIENQRLYNKLGLRWRLTKLKCNSNSLFEYVLLIEFLPVLSLYQPD